MNKTLTIIGLCFLFAIQTFAQTTISGVVTDAHTGAGIEGARVFFFATTAFAETNSEGMFLMENVPDNQTRIVVVAKGFEPVTRTFELAKDSETNLEIALAPAAGEAGKAPDLSDKKDRKRLKAFAQGLLGFSKLANKCTILNPEALAFRELKDGTLDVRTTDVLRVDNDATGYIFHIWLDYFKLPKRDIADYSALLFFEEKIPKEVREIEQWNAARRNQFFGSPQHFFMSLKKGELESAGFKIYDATLANGNQFIELGPANPENIVGDEEGAPHLLLSNYLKVVYLNGKDEVTPRAEMTGYSITHLIRPTSVNGAPMPVQSVHSREVQISYLFTNRKKVKLTSHGIPEDPRLIRYEGYWRFNNLAGALPGDYLPVTESHEETTIAEALEVPEVPAKNGFEMTNLLVRPEYIIESGLSPDDRPPINNPLFVSSGQAREFLTDDDWVIGVPSEGTPKAYPLRILERHEVVNDEIDGQPIAITWSPLCRSAIVFLRDIQGIRRTFASSGLIFNNATLLFDYETRTLWSQIMGRAISGNAAGTPLEFLPVIVTTFKKWRELNPQSLVLSPKTGLKTDYAALTNLTEYYSNQEVKYQVTRSSDNLPNKELVLGVQVGFKKKAYPFSELRKTGGKLEDTINGKAVVIHFDPATYSAWVTDRKGHFLPGTPMYWFAWYAFHPDTDVFWLDK
ncbi:MAG: DUF3179 domain-containing protein [Bacteroidetes bacterium]|nr:MAG: DUF3179 domain-containing protein [Bacteroidota bacterium]